MSNISQMAREALTAVPQVRLAYLYGSQARGIATASSDVDVAILSEPELGPRELDRLAEALELALDRDVDLTSLRRAPPLLLREIVLHGQALVVADPAEQVAFEVAAMREFNDTQHLRDVQHHYQSLRAKARHGDQA